MLGNLRKYFLKRFANEIREEETPRSKCSPNVFFLREHSPVQSEVLIMRGKRLPQQALVTCIAGLLA